MQTPLNTIVVQLYNTGAALKSSRTPVLRTFSVLVAVNLKGMGAVLVCVRGTLRSYSAWAGESPTSKSTTRSCACPVHEHLFHASPKLRPAPPRVHDPVANRAVIPTMSQACRFSSWFWAATPKPFHVEWVQSFTQLPNGGDVEFPLGSKMLNTVTGASVAAFVLPCMAPFLSVP
jgi:hypothetical protein